MGILGAKAQIPAQDDRRNCQLNNRCDAGASGASAATHDVARGEANPPPPPEAEERDHVKLPT